MRCRKCCLKYDNKDDLSACYGTGIGLMQEVVLSSVILSLKQYPLKIFWHFFSSVARNFIAKFYRQC